MVDERSLYEPTTPEKCAAELAALPDELRALLQTKLSVRAPMPAVSPFPAYLLRIEFGRRGADMAIDIGLLAEVYRQQGIDGVIGLIAAEMRAFWEALELERKSVN